MFNFFELNFLSYLRTCNHSTLLIYQSVSRKNVTFGYILRNNTNTHFLYNGNNGTLLLLYSSSFFLLRIIMLFIIFYNLAQFSASVLHNVIQLFFVLIIHLLNLLPLLFKKGCPVNGLFFIE